MLYRLVLDIPFTPDSLFQRQMNHKTRGWTVTRNGLPVVECSTTEEADDWLRDAEREARKQTPKTAEPERVTLTGDALRRQAAKDTADLFGE